MENEQIIEDFLTAEPELLRAEGVKRFANFIIDILTFYLLIFVLAILTAVLAPSLIEKLDNDSTGFNLVDRLLTLAFYGLYMGTLEAVFKGKSLGKLITKTRAINLDGSQISAATAFKRGFSRAVPFCAFSALGKPCEPWQDRWTDTMVIDEKQSALMFVNS